MITSSITPQEVLALMLPKLATDSTLYQRLTCQLATDQWTKVYVGLNRATEVIDQVNELAGYRARELSDMEESKEDFTHLGPVMVKKL